MKYEVKVTGPVSINLSSDEVTAVKFLSDSPDDSNARSSELTLSATVEGKILYDALSEVQSDQMAIWAVKDHENESDYANVEITCTGADSSIASQVLFWLNTMSLSMATVPSENSELYSSR